MKDPSSLFNVRLEAKATCGIDFHKGDRLDKSAVKELVRVAVDDNISGDKKK